jgi:hypothetical protein
MHYEKYYKLAKFSLIIPLVVGLITIAEQFLPLQKVSETVEYKHVSKSLKSGTTYSIDFTHNNDQFTEEIYNAVSEGNSVILETRYFSKEVNTLQPENSTKIYQNNTSEIYFLLGIAIAFIAFSVYFLRKPFYTNKNYKYIIFVCLFGVVSLIRILKLNL